MKHRTIQMFPRQFSLVCSWRYIHTKVLHLKVCSTFQLVASQIDASRLHFLLPRLAPNIGEVQILLPLSLPLRDH